MKHKFVELSRSMLLIVMNHLVFIVFAVAVMGLFDMDSNDLWLWIVLGIVPVALHLARLAVRNFFLFFALHLYIPVLMMLLPLRILQKVLVMAIIIVYVVWSIMIRMKERTNDEELFTPMFVLPVMGVAALIESLHSKKGWEGIYLTAAIVYLACYYIYYFVNEYLRFLAVNESSAANIPEREIFASGMKQTLVFVLGGVLVLLFTANIGWVSYILSMVWKVLSAFLRFLFSGISYEEQEEIAPYVQEQMQGGGGFPKADGDPFILWVILEKIILVLVPLLMITAAAAGIAAGIRYLWKHFHAERAVEEKKLQTGIDIRESCAIEKTKKESNGLFAFLSYRERIRKLYRKQVLKNKQVIVGELDAENLERMTAGECCDRISAAGLQEAYEKARYSQENITAEHIKLAKSAER